MVKNYVGFMTLDFVISKHAKRMLGVETQILTYKGSGIWRVGEDLLNIAHGVWELMPSMFWSITIKPMLIP